MTESTITLQGFVGADPVMRTAGGHVVANFRVACTPRRLNRATGEWGDGATQWYTVNAWRRLGENVSRSLRKGDAVVVHGRLSARTYVNKDGLEVSTFEIEAGVIGHDLNRGLTHLIKNDRREAPAGVAPMSGDRNDTEREEALAQAEHDWGATPLAAPPGFEETEPDGAPVPAA